MVNTLYRNGQYPVVVLSGGWGYGNLGDDAILVSTVKLISDQLPEAAIRVLTNDVEGGAELLKAVDRLTVYPSVHRRLFSDDEIFYLDTKLTFAEKIKHGILLRKKEKASRRVLRRYLQSPDAFMASQEEVLKELDDIMGDADFYVMGGGGYVNDWIESDIVKHIECVYARKHGLRLMMMGQTIGPFGSAETLRVGQEICGMMHGMFFRDEESIGDCGQENTVMKTAVPDLALYEHVEAEERDNRILFIPFNPQVLAHIDFLISNLKSMSEQTGAIVTVAVSQLWQNAIEQASACYLHFKEAGIRTELVIPRDVAALQKLAATSQLLVSQNLHGLILGYRAETKILSINKARKFVGFMDKVGLSEYMLDLSEAQGSDLSDMALKLQEEHPHPYSSSLVTEITNAFNQMMS